MEFKQKPTIVTSGGVDIVSDEEAFRRMNTFMMNCIGAAHGICKIETDSEFVNLMLGVTMVYLRRKYEGVQLSQFFDEVETIVKRLREAEGKKRVIQ